MTYSIHQKYIPPKFWIVIHEKLFVLTFLLFPYDSAVHHHFLPFFLGKIGLKSNQLLCAMWNSWVSCCFSSAKP